MNSAPMAGVPANGSPVRAEAGPSPTAFAMRAARLPVPPVGGGGEEDGRDGEHRGADDAGARPGQPQEPTASQQPGRWPWLLRLLGFSALRAHNPPLLTPGPSHLVPTRTVSILNRDDLYCQCTREEPVRLLRGCRGSGQGTIRRRPPPSPALVHPGPEVLVVQVLDRVERPRSSRGQVRRGGVGPGLVGVAGARDHGGDAGLLRRSSAARLGGRRGPAAPAAANSRRTARPRPRSRRRRTSRPTSKASPCRL